MNQCRPAWIRYSELAFSFNFVAFSFVMFSCLFPTGFSATFSTLAFIFAVPVFLHRSCTIELNYFEKMGVALFCWLLISIFWSDSPLSNSLKYLSEYRIYFMLPVFITVLASDAKTQQLALGAATIGAFVALTASYGLGFGWWTIEGATLSLANRIYHGVIMSSLLLFCLLVARWRSGHFRVAALLVAILVIYNVLAIEIGRTGYLLVVATCVLLGVLTFSKARLVMFISSALLGVFLCYVTLDKFHATVNHTIENVQNVIEGGEYNSSAGMRIEFYRVAFGVGREKPLTGVGVGSVASTLEAKFKSGEMRVFTDNVHSEFMHMMMAGGVPGLLMFTGFILAIIYSGVTHRKRSKILGDALIGIGVILIVSALFNSVIKDYGEKHALIIILSIIGSRMLLEKRAFQSPTSKNQ